jgi:hypothetical protein
VSKKAAVLAKKMTFTDEAARDMFRLFCPHLLNMSENNLALMLFLV